MKRSKILIFPSGSENALEIYDSLKYNIHFELYGFSARKNYTDFLYPEGMYEYADNRLMIDDPEFESVFISLVQQYEIEYIIPTFDNVAMKLAEISEKIPAGIVGSPYDTTVIASNKKLMYNVLGKFDFTPKVYSSVNDVKSFPVFIKPEEGYGSIDTCVVKSKKDLCAQFSKNNKLIICEYLPGEEITVDCFTDRHGELRFIGPRRRERIMNGMMYRGTNICISDEVYHIANTINNTLAFRGAWYFQAKRNSDGMLKLLEFSVRLPTNCSLYSHLGVNFSALSLFDAMGIDVDVLCNDFTLQQERRVTAAYKANIEYDTVYIDFDDTVTTHGKVNTDMIKLIYQFFNKGKHIVMISNHNTGDLYEEMKRFCIPAELFDEIIWIKDNTPKYKYMKFQNAIFIDNCFKIRKEVMNKCGIPVFDVDAANCLADSADF